MRSTSAAHVHRASIAGDRHGSKKDIPSILTSIFISSASLSSSLHDQKQSSSSPTKRSVFLAS